MSNPKVVVGPHSNGIIRANGPREQSAAMTSAGDSGNASCEAVLREAALASSPPPACAPAERSSSAPISVPNLRSVTASWRERSRLRAFASSAAL